MHSLLTSSLFYEHEHACLPSGDVNKKPPIRGISLEANSEWDPPSTIHALIGEIRRDDTIGILLNQAIQRCIVDKVELKGDG